MAKKTTATTPSAKTEQPLSGDRDAPRIMRSYVDSRHGVDLFIYEVIYSTEEQLNITFKEWGGKAREKLAAIRQLSELPNGEFLVKQEVVEDDYHDLRKSPNLCETGWHRFCNARTRYLSNRTFYLRNRALTLTELEEVKDMTKKHADELADLIRDMLDIAGENINHTQQPKTAAKTAARAEAQELKKKITDEAQARGMDKDAIDTHLDVIVIR
jgi:hypothetical protein